MRELATVAITVAMKEEQENIQNKNVLLTLQRVSQSPLPTDLKRFTKYPSFENLLKVKETKSLLEYIYTEGFFSYLEINFIESNDPFAQLVKPKFQILLEKRTFFFSNFKEFQKTKNPKYLGRAISVYPHLLSEKSIGLLIETYIFNNANNKNKKNKSDLSLLCEGLKYKYKEDDLYYSNDSIKFLHSEIHSRLSHLFKVYKPKIEDRADVIRKLFKKKKLPFLDEWCRIWARGKEPRRIALRIVQTFEAYNRDDMSFIQDLKKRFNPPNRINLNKLNKIVANNKSV